MLRDANLLFTLFDCVLFKTICSLYLSKSELYGYFAMSLLSEDFTELETVMSCQTRSLSLNLARQL